MWVEGEEGGRGRDAQANVPAAPARRSPPLGPHNVLPGRHGAARCCGARAVGAASAAGPARQTDTRLVAGVAAGGGKGSGGQMRPEVCRSGAATIVTRSTGRAESRPVGALRARQHNARGVSVHGAARQASRQRLTTVAVLETHRNSAGGPRQPGAKAGSRRGSGGTGARHNWPRCATDSSAVRKRAGQGLGQGRTRTADGAPAPHLSCIQRSTSRPLIAP